MTRYDLSHMKAADIHWKIYNINLQDFDWYANYDLSSIIWYKNEFHLDEKSDKESNKHGANSDWEKKKNTKW